MGIISSGQEINSWNTLFALFVLSYAKLTVITLNR